MAKYLSRISLYCLETMVTLVSILSPIFLLLLLIDSMVLANFEAEEMSEPTLLSENERGKVTLGKILSC